MLFIYILLWYGSKVTHSGILGIW